jgi:hypothetical protein
MKKHKIFETNPNLKEVHMTSDGETFYKDNDAKMHAKSLKDKTVELVINPSLLEVITDEDNFDEDGAKIGEGSGEVNTGTEAKADGSENVLIVAKMEGDALANLPELSVEETQDKINLGGDEINIVTAPIVETPDAVAAEIKTPEVETPEVKSTKATPKNNK